MHSENKYHRTTRRGNKAPFGMDRGPQGPHITCATFRTQMVDMHCMWRQGEVQPNSGRSSRRFVSKGLHESSYQQNARARPSLVSQPMISKESTHMRVVLRRAVSGREYHVLFVAFVDFGNKSHRTTLRGNKAPIGMDRGPSGPHIMCATFRKQRVDMQSVWRQGSW